MFTNIELKDFIQKHETEILKNDWESIYNDFPSLKDVSKLTDFLLNKVHINPLFYMTSVPEGFAKNLDIKSVIIPNSVESIDDFAFYNCSKLTSITLPNSVTSIRSCTFYGCSSLTSINIPNSVESIDDFAFYNCSKLTSITIPSSVTEIGYRAFAGCDNLKEIKYTGNQQQWDKLLATSENFANWIRENKVKVNLL